MSRDGQNAAMGWIWHAGRRVPTPDLDEYDPSDLADLQYMSDLPSYNEAERNAN